MRLRKLPPFALMVPLLFAGGCDGPVDTPTDPAVEMAKVPDAVSEDEWYDQVYQFSAAVFDIDAEPDGGLLVAENTTIKEIRRGEIGEVGMIPAVPGSPINGLKTVGRGDFFATSGGQDLALGAGVWHVSHGQAKLVGDIEAFETMNDPDAFESPQWKNQLCEADPAQGFSAGPQSNPYHVTMRSGSDALVADAAGNVLLSASKNGKLDWVALFTPPTDGNGSWRFLKTAEGDPGIDCYVQPVPTSVAIGPDGAYYVGELTGAPSVPGWSRIWRIEPGAHHVVCPSDECQVFADGFTSVIDLAFGPEGMLYVVEYEANGWLAVLLQAPLEGGRISRCDMGTGDCQVVADGLTLPSAITFDKWGHLWLLENNIIAPTVRVLDVD